MWVRFMQGHSETNGGQNIAWTLLFLSVSTKTLERYDVDFDFRVGFFLFELYLGNIYHGQNVSSNRNETLTVRCSHSAETVEFRYGFKLLRLALRFLIFSCLSRHRMDGGFRVFMAFVNMVQHVKCLDQMDCPTS